MGNKTKKALIGLEPVLSEHENDGDDSDLCVGFDNNNDPDDDDDFVGAVFPRNAIALDWRRRPRVEPERDASRRGWEFNMSSVYAHGVWRPALGVQFIFDASAPTS